MSLFNKYDSSKSNTDIPITSETGYAFRKWTRSLSSTTTYGTEKYTLSGFTLYSIPASYFGSGTSILIKVVAPLGTDYADTNNRFPLSFFQTGSGVSYQTGYNPTYIWRKGEYIYAQFDNLSLLSSSSPLYIVYFYNSTTSSSYTYQNYRPAQVVSATSFASWAQSHLKIYDNGQAHIIQPSIYRADMIQNSEIISNAYRSQNYLQSRVWEVTPGNTYTLTSNIIKNKSNMFCGTITTPLILNQSYNESYYTVPTPTTDPDTGLYVYSITIPSGKTSLRVSCNTDMHVSIQCELYGQRTAGWYDIDDYNATNNYWFNTENTTYRFSI